MRQAFAQFFAFFTTLFSACEKGAKTLDNYASWAEQESDAFCKESQVERQARMAKLEHELAEQQKSLGIIEGESQPKAA